MVNSNFSGSKVISLVSILVGLVLVLVAVCAMFSGRSPSEGRGGIRSDRQSYEYPAQFGLDKRISSLGDVM